MVGGNMLMWDCSGHELEKGNCFHQFFTMCNSVGHYSIHNPNFLEPLLMA